MRIDAATTDTEGGNRPDDSAAWQLEQDWNNSREPVIAGRFPKLSVATERGSGPNWKRQQDVAVQRRPGDALGDACRNQ